MSTEIHTGDGESNGIKADRLDVLGDACARTILIAASGGPKTAKELTAKTDSSSATVYRRLNNLLECGLLVECIKFDADGTHTTAYEATVSSLSVDVSATGINVSVTSTQEER